VTRPPGTSRAAIIGVGELTPVRRTEGATTMGLLARAARLALDDAGLEPGDVDGLFMGPQVGETPQHVPATLAEYLGLAPRAANVVDLGGATGPGMIWRAAATIDAGMAETVLCLVGNHRNPEPVRSPNRNPIREFDVPHGASGANASYAFLKSAHMAAHGTADADYAQIAAISRAHAQDNPAAIFHGTPATLQDVLDSPYIAEPLHLLEIVMPVAGATAVVVVSPERAAALAADGRLPHPPVHLLGAGEKVTHRAMSQAPSLTSGPLRPAIAQAYAQAETGPGGLDVLSLYDCYTVVTALTLEDAGLCPPGGFARWFGERDVSHRGEVTYNPHGGQLGCGQADLAGGMSHAIEAVHQLRGTARGRQHHRADGRPSTALVTGNGATLSEAVALVLRGEGVTA